MASPLKTGKQSVNLSAPVRGSRIRRDPPPAAKKEAVVDPEEREARMVVIGVGSFALAIMVILAFGFSSWGWTPSHYTIHVQDPPRAERG